MKKLTQKTQAGQDLTQGPVLRGLVLFAIPIVAANLIQQLYSLADLVIIGHYVGNIGTVGVSTGGEMLDMLTPVAAAFATAGQIYIAQLKGAKDEEGVKKGSGTLLAAMTLMSIMFAIAAVVLRQPLLRILNCPREALWEAEKYMVITAIGVPFIFGYNGVCGILRGMGESKRPMLFIGVAAVVNIFLDLIMVVWFQMGAAGTAVATVVSQLASFLAAFIYMYRCREQFDFKISFSYFRIDKEAFRVILAQGIPQAARSMFVRFSMLWVNSGINAYGLIVSATNSVGNKLMKFLEVYTISFQQAAGAMVGQNLGAQKPERAKKTCNTAFAVCVVLTIIMVSICIFFPRHIFGIFTKDLEVLDLGVIYLEIMLVHFFLSSLTCCYQAMVIGSGFASLNFIIGILDGVICKIGLSLIFLHVLGMGYLSYFWGTALSRALPGLICLVYFLSGSWKTRKLLVKKR